MINLLGVVLDHFAHLRKNRIRCFSYNIGAFFGRSHGDAGIYIAVSVTVAAAREYVPRFIDMDVPIIILRKGRKQFGHFWCLSPLAWPLLLLSTCRTRYGLNLDVHLSAHNVLRISSVQGHPGGQRARLFDFFKTCGGHTNDLLLHARLLVE